MSRVFGWTLAAVVSLTIGVLTVCLGLFANVDLYLLDLFSFGSSLGSSRCKLVIGILSSRDNDARRRLIRRTWLSRSYGPQVCIRFVVGSEECAVPPEDRLDAYGCEPWIVDNPGPGTHFLASIGDESTTCDFVRGLNVGVRLKVRHPVVVNKLGISIDVLQRNKEMTVFLTATDSQEIVAQVSFTSEQPGTVHGGFSYRPVEPILLPKGYEATIVSAKLATQDPVEWDETSCSTINFDSGGNVIEILRVFDADGVPYSDIADVQVAVSFGYFIYDDESLRKHVETAPSRLIQWQSQSEAQSEALRREAASHRDVLLVDAVDTYRNLPRKLLLFYAWVARHRTDAHHVIKMDDDSVVNVPRLLHLLETAPELLGRETVWWGRFRHHWSVEQHGKWLERDYTSVSYPPFACGVASLLTTDIVQWLANNRDHLHLFQGEDTSMGIWLAALQPTILEDNRWQCDDTCRTDSLSVGQLNEHLIEESWKSLQTCGQLCLCSDTT